MTPSELLKAYIEREKRREQDWLVAIGLDGTLYDLYLKFPDSLPYLQAAQAKLEQLTTKVAEVEKRYADLVESRIAKFDNEYFTMGNMRHFRHTKGLE